VSGVGKRVVLKLDGDFEQRGFQASLEIGPENDRPLIEVAGALPPAPDLVKCLEQWQQAYRSLGIASRIMPQEIIYDGSVNPLDNCRRFAYHLRDGFNLWLEASSFRTVDRRLRETLSIDEPIRVLIRTQDSYLRRLPWHSWDFIERYPRAEIALAASTLQWSARPPSRTGNVRILAILGDRRGIQVEADRQLLEQLPDAEVMLLIEPSRHQISQQLWEQHWDILFFAGHSQTEGVQGRIDLNPQESLTLEDIKYGLRRAISPKDPSTTANGLQLAIFNSCDGLGLAHELEQLHLPQMIVMREPVPDRVAQEFLKQFLLAYVSGESLYLAERQAREQLQGLESEYPCASWLPVLCQNSINTPPTWKELVGEKKGSGVKGQGLGAIQNSKFKIQNSPTSNSRFPIPHSPFPNTKLLSSLLLSSWIVTAFVVGLRFLGGLQSLELWALDQLMQLRPSEGLDQRVLVVKATEQDFQQLREDPLSDRTVTQLLKKLEQYQPKVIGLDLYRDIPQGTGRSDLLKQLQQSDRVIAACKVPDNDDPGIAPPLGLPKQRLGFTDVVVDSNQIIRRQLLSVSPKPASPCSTGYALSFLLATHYLQAMGYPINITPANDWQIGEVVFKRLRSTTGGYQTIDTSGSQILLNYRNPVQVAQQVTVTDVLKDPSPQYIKNRIVLIGVDTTNKDRYLTPYSHWQETNQTVPGVIIHAQMVSQILSAVLDRRPLLRNWPIAGEVLWIWSCSLVGGLLALFLRSPLHLALAGGPTLFILSGLCFLGFLKQGCWMPLVPSAIALILTSGSVTICIRPRRSSRNLSKQLPGTLKSDSDRSLCSTEMREKQINLRH